MKKALLVIDVQNDFCQGGALEVPMANEIFEYTNQLLASQNYDEIVFSQDFHPSNHISFAANHQEKEIGEFIELPNKKQQILWPIHCVQNTFGSKIHSDLVKPKQFKIIQKGMNKMVDSYSAFYDNNHEIATGLTDYLKSKNIIEVEIVGLALDYCVKFTALDAVKEGFITSVHFNGTKAVNINPRDGIDTIIELIQNGVTIIA